MGEDDTEQGIGYSFSTVYTHGSLLDLALVLNVRREGENKKGNAIDVLACNYESKLSAWIALIKIVRAKG